MVKARRHVPDVEIGVLERTGELAQIDLLAERAAAGAGGAVTIQGPAGQGKSTLLGIVSARLADRGFHVASARGVDQERSHPFGVIRQLFDRVLADGVTRRSALAGGAAAVGALFSPGLDALDTTTAQVLHGLYWLVANLAQGRPIALVVDDAHDADDASLEFASYLARRVDDLPVLVLIALRTPGQHDPRPTIDAVREECRTTLDLAPLTVDAVTCIVSDVLGAPCDREFGASCHERTGGNPFYLRELLNEVRRRGLTPTVDALAWVSALGPPVIVRSVLFRLAALPDAALPLARSCAVLGDGAQLWDAVQLAGITMDSAVRAADALVAAEVLAAGDDLRFAHAILRSAVLEDLGPHERRFWHARAAAHFRRIQAPPRIVAAHLLASGPAADDEVVEILRAAARDALRAGGASAAVEFLRRALAEPPGRRAQAEVAFELGLAEAAHGDRAALEHLRAGVDAADDPRVRGERALRFAAFAQQAGPVEAAVPVLDDALARLPDDGSDLVLLLHAERYWNAHLSLRTAGDLGDGAIRLRRALDRDDDELRRRIAAYLAMDAGRSAPRAETIAFAREATKEPGLLAFCSPDASAVVYTLVTLISVERHADFDELADQVVAAAAREGNPVAFVLASSLRAMEYLVRGRLQDVLDETDSTRVVATEARLRHAPALVALQVRALVGRGRVEEAHRVLAGYRSEFDPQELTECLLLEARGHLRAASGEVRGALDDFLLCGDRLRGLGIMNPGLVAWRSAAALQHLQLGERGTALELAAAEARRAGEMSGAIRHAAARRVLARCVGGSEARALLEDAAESLEGSPGALERARLRADLGALLRRDRRLAEARHQLGLALHDATTCGAPGLAQFARDELIAAGGRPRRTRLFGAEALTPAELRVARLAADGATNTVIAQTLFLSRKTVEKHLAGAYRKLGIDGRAQLPAALSTASADPASP